MSSHRFMINYHTMIHYFLYSSDFQLLAQNYWRTKVRKESSPVECDDNIWLATFQPIMKWMECDRCVLGHVYAMLLLQAAFSVCKHGEVYEFIFCSPWSRQTSCRERFKYDSNLLGRTMFAVLTRWMYANATAWYFHFLAWTQCGSGGSIVQSR